MRVTDEVVSPAADVLPFGDAGAIAGSIRQGKLSSREALQCYLDRIDRLDARLNAVVTLDVDRALEAARVADDAIVRGADVGPLHGVPVTIKDVIETAGIRTTAGSPRFAGHIPERSAPVVERLERAGAIVFGKTNLPEFAGGQETNNPLFGVTNNPWDVSRTPGGSSGGAAAAVAAGLTTFDLGSDNAGSIRQPASNCGIYGHYPTFGIVPLLGHIPHTSPTRPWIDSGCIGPLARSAGDLGLILHAIAMPLEREAKGWILDLPPPRHSKLRDFRVATWGDDPFCPVAPEVAGVLSGAVETLRRAGATVTETSPEEIDLETSHRTWRSLVLAPFGALVTDEEFDAALEAGSEDDSTRAITQRHRAWLVACEERERVRSAWDRFFRDFDVLLTPVSPVAAVPHSPLEKIASASARQRHTITVDGRTRPYLDQVVWPGIAGLGGLPATVAPAGRTSEGLPVGVQILGSHLEDRTTIAFARMLSEVLGGFDPPPGF